MKQSSEKEVKYFRKGYGKEKESLFNRKRRNVISCQTVKKHI